MPASMNRSAFRLEGIDPTRTALLGINYQNYSLIGSLDRDPRAQRVLSNTNLLAKATRNAGGRVIWLRHTVTATGVGALPRWLTAMNTAFYQQQGDELREGSEGHELLAELENDKDDLLVNKYRYSALCPGSSDLAEMLLKLGIRSLIVAGGPTNTCCDSTARDAMMLGYKVVVAADATIADTEMDHQGSLRTLGTYFCDVRTTTETTALILSGGGARM